MAILLVVLLLHVVAIRWLALTRNADESPGHDDAVLVIDFIDLPAQKQPVPTPEQKPPVSKPAASAHEPIASRQTHLPAKRRRAQPSSVPADEPLQLYDPDGSVRTPDDMLEQIDKSVGDQRVFSYQIPHLDDAKKYFYRNRALTYEGTRFDQYWIPDDQDMLTELLTRMVEATTKEITIPVPGNPGSKMVCRISLLALGGGCGILSNGANYVGPVDDPETLSPEEDRQCQAWWEQIIGAKTQDVWRSTRSIYEKQCRKPLARRS
jgi:hypothetical protein